MKIKLKQIEDLNFFIDTINTTDTSVHTISQITPVINKTTLIKIHVIAYGNGEWASYVYHLIITRATGVPVIQLKNEITSDDGFGFLHNGIQFSVSGNDIIIQVQSDNAVSINWTNKYEII